MNFTLLKTIFLLLFFILVFGCGGGQHDSRPGPTADGPTAKNIILFIGDGMGAEYRKAARWASVGEAGRLSMDDMPVTSQGPYSEMLTGVHDNTYIHKVMLRAFAGE